MQLFDTHFHCYGENTPQEFMKEVHDFNGDVVADINLMAVGGNYSESLRAMDFSNVVKHAWFAAGVHPHQAADYCIKRENFSVFAAMPKLKAVGELGLDYYYDISDRDSQQIVLSEFLSLALKWNLPAIIHLRDKDESTEAYREAYAQLLPYAEQGGRFVIHCYAGSVEWAYSFLELGGFLGVTGMITFKRAENIRNVLKIIPESRLLLETDSPYLAPVPYRGRENHPGMVRIIAECVAELRNLSLLQLAEITTRNAKQFFRISEDQE